MMENLEALKVISRHRGEHIVVPTMTCNREWSPISTNPDFDLPVGGSMGKASSLGLGLALARPDKKVLVLDGDGSLLMNLGSLVTIANMAPPNLVHFVFENTVYRTTGGQPIPNVGKFSFTALAKDAGYANVHEFNNPEDLESNIDNVINERGPTFVRLEIAPATERPPTPFVRTLDVLPRFRAALQRSAP
jgi:thiamine pyrophosphate-dependent acetolactate synthase large subunit-like protein